MDAINILATNPALFILFVGIFALIVGSFLTVAIHRLPKMMMNEWHEQAQEFLTEYADFKPSTKPFNLWLPRSHCPSCEKTVPFFYNIPLLGYLFSKGKCYHCKHVIPFRYPFIEILSLLLSLFVAWHFGFSAQTLAGLVFTWILLILTYIDLDHQLLPDELTLGLLWIGLFLSLCNVFANPSDAIIGALSGYLFLWGVAKLFKLITKKDGMGHGDFKLLAAFGAWLGWQLLPFILVAASILGTIVGLGMIAFKNHSRHKPIPFGPFLAIAGWVAMMWGQQWTSWYLNLFYY